MLDFMRRNARSFGIKVALGVISLVFVFFMGGGGQIGAGPRALATVGDIEVTRQEYELAQRRNESYFRQQFQGQINAEMLKSLNIPKMTLDQLIDGAALRSEAERLGLSVTPDAIRDQLRRVPSFQSNGQFSPNLYRDTLRSQGMTPGAFEETVRQDLLEAQLADIIRRGAHASEDQAWDAYQRANRKMKLSYVAIDAEPLEAGVSLDEAALTAYYENKQENWRRPPSVKVRALAYKVPDTAAKIEVSDFELNEYYELNKNTEFQSQEQVGARHILKKVDKDAGDDAKAAARAAIDAIAKQLADGGDFEAIAEAESEDPGSAAKGGDLGLFGRGEMVPPFDAAAFTLEVGKTSDVVETDFGYHIIRVYEKVEAGVSPFDKVKDQIKTTLATRAAIDRVFDDSAEDAAKIADGATLESVATARGVAIEELPLFSQGDVVPGIGQAPAFLEASFLLANPGDVSQPAKVGNDYYLIELVERKDSTIPTLDEVRTEIDAALRTEKAIDLARERADELLAEVKAGATLAQIAQRNGLTVETAEDVGGNASFVKGVGAVQGLAEVASSATKDGEPLSRSFVSGGKAFLFVRDSVTEASRESFDAVKDDEITRLKTAREQEALQEFIRSLKEKEEITFDMAQLRPLLGDAAPGAQ